MFDDVAGPPRGYARHTLGPSCGIPATLSPLVIRYSAPTVPSVDPSRGVSGEWLIRGRNLTRSADVDYF